MPRAAELLRLRAAAALDQLDDLLIAGIDRALHEGRPLIGLGRIGGDRGLVGADGRRLSGGRRGRGGRRGDRLGRVDHLVAGLLGG